jgi:nitrogen fixation/metabolism regulation signal transduction histidine kinase
MRLRLRRQPSQEVVTALQAELDEMRSALEGVRQELDGRMDELEERTRFTECLLTEAAGRQR